jgi:hypothetical protein
MWQFLIELWFLKSYKSHFVFELNIRITNFFQVRSAIILQENLVVLKRYMLNHLGASVLKSATYCQIILKKNLQSMQYSKCG